MENASRIGRKTLPKSLSKERLRLWLKLLKASKWVEGELRERLRIEFDTTLPRFDVMAALQRHGDGLTMSVLSGELRVSNGNVTGIVDRLVEEGLVVRIPVLNDRRATTVRLTGKGRERFSVMAARHEEWVDELLATLDEEVIRTLSMQLEQVISAPMRREA